MQAVSDVSENTQRGFDVLSWMIGQLFPGSRTELLPSQFKGIEGGTIIIHTDEKGRRVFYDIFFNPIRNLTRRWREEHDIAFGFDVEVAS